MSPRTLAELERVSPAEWSDDELQIIKATHGSGKEPTNGEPAKPRAEIVVTLLSEVERKPLKWLWPGVFPLGKLSLLVGDPSLGKSLVSLDMAARISRGEPWPDGSLSQIGQVILFSAEDDPSDTIAPRLDAKGALGDLITIASGVNDGKRRRGFNLDTDIGKLESIITDQTRLVVIDPITAYLGGTDSHVTGEVRGVLAPLADLAARRGVAVLAISHLNKGSAAQAMYRVTGSLAFVAAARSAWVIGQDPEDNDRMLMMLSRVSIFPTPRVR